MTYSLQQREVFHLVFLRHLVRRLKVGSYALKGGTNLRFFFRSIRYSEDMDIDVAGIAVHSLRDAVMSILSAPSLLAALRPHRVEKIIPPSMASAKQTETVQRFKVHLINQAGENLFTKVEFSRRGLKAGAVSGGAVSEAIDGHVLSEYRLPPLIVSHYPIDLAVLQKISAVTGRAVPQARDIFDLFLLSTQMDAFTAQKIRKKIADSEIKKSRDIILSVSFEQYRDTVCAYLDPKDAELYQHPERWEEIQLAVLTMMGAEDL
ncbi:MAG: nucleotidyl transferase AbiEii/AbiGii toxin family protein [Deltaproteobacteria bacterium]|nr:nucleotidyl transferase AbiEii/AbiGii toxin family protein [Deltaproteobacteria bacterium]